MWETQVRHGGVSESCCFLERDVVWCVLALGRFATSILKAEERIQRRQHLDTETASLTAYAKRCLNSDDSRSELCA
jgi:hypothetical protein